MSMSTCVCVCVCFVCVCVCVCVCPSVYVWRVCASQTLGPFRGELPEVPLAKDVCVCVLPVETFANNAFVYLQLWL